SRVTRVAGEGVYVSLGGRSARLTRADPNLRESLSAGSPLLVEVVSANSGRKELVVKAVPRTEGALVALDPRTGAVRAMVGGRDFERSQFNRATQALRQPGSAFKPFVYGAALERGMRPSEILLDAPVSFRDPSTGKWWKPTNYGRRFYGRVTLQEALEKSINVATIRLLDKVGPRRAYDLAHRLGIQSPLDPYLSLALGTSVVSLLEITSAYSTVANGGLWTRPYAIERVETPGGRTLYERKPRFKRALEPETAYLLTHMMKGVIRRGTGKRARGLGEALAGKTGTTDEFKDAWFIGFSPNLALGTWVGLDSNEPLGPRETGARAALPAWMDAMAAWLKDHPPGKFPIPPGIRLVDVDGKTGLLAGPGCSRSVIRMAFRDGNEPSRTCGDGRP
ncbi:MAG: penicillin-binding transpeptidase domain-containing protein, partial [Nitrospinota bacterium]